MDWLRESFEPEPQTAVNPIKQALAMRQLLGTPGIGSKADIARYLGISRARVTQTLNLLKLAPEIQKHILALPDEEAAFFTEHRLRQLTRIVLREAQREAFHGLLSQARREFPATPP